MTAVTGREPGHWHNADGVHTMADPRRSIDSFPERWWDADERAYVTHLQTHEGERTDPQRSGGDSPAVRAIFDLLESREKECETLRALVTARREHDAAKAALGEG